MVAVGPLNFKRVMRAGNPIAALYTTPAIALVCLIAMGVIAYASKGVLSRYRAVELIELPVGDTRGVRTEFLGFYTTRPMRIDVAPGQGARVDLVHRSSGGESPRQSHHEGGVALRGVGAGLWETVVVRHQSPHHGAIRAAIRRTTSGGSAVRNEGSVPLANAIFIDEMGQLFALGEIVPGAEVRTEASLGAALSQWEFRPGRSRSDTLDELLRRAGYEDESTRLAARGALFGMGERGVQRGLFAQLGEITAGAEDGSADGFSREWARRFVFVPARITPAPIPASTEESAPADPAGAPTEERSRPTAKR